jgi:predicted metalloprotease with PDZ domain
MDADDLRADWVLAHELFHLGVPSMPGGAWLDEGLATYYEPVLRTRAGLVSEMATWTELFG